MSARMGRVYTIGEHGPVWSADVVSMSWRVTDEPVVTVPFVRRRWWQRKAPLWRSGTFTVSMDELAVRKMMRMFGMEPGPLAAWPIVFAVRVWVAWRVWRMLERPRAVSVMVGLWRWLRGRYGGAA